MAEGIDGQAATASTCSSQEARCRVGEGKGRLGMGVAPPLVPQLTRMNVWHQRDQIELIKVASPAAEEEGCAEEGGGGGGSPKAIEGDSAREIPEKLYPHPSSQKRELFYHQRRETV